MHILVAPDSFKGSLTSIQVASSIEKGILEVYPHATVTLLPMADGGEGTVDALLSAAGGQHRNSAVGGHRHVATVQGPLGRPVEAHYGVLPNGTAVIEMAAASGLPLLSADERNVQAASTYGTGQLLKQALDAGSTRIIMGLGGSATNDGGAGAAAALGARFLDSNGNDLPPGGAALKDLATIDTSGLDARLATVEITLASDVDNPLCGQNGASAVFGPQKGASPKEVRLLDEALAHFSNVVKEQLGLDLADIPGAGAAGGLGYGMMAFCNAEISSGVDLILDALDMEEILKDVDLVITGEAKIDAQTLAGKVPVGVGRRAQAQGVPVIAIVGSIGKGAEQVYQCGVDAIISAAIGPMKLEEMMENASILVQDAAERAMRLVAVGAKHHEAR